MGRARQLIDPQLGVIGVNSNTAIWRGGLANNSLFFGTATAEIVSTNTAGHSNGWNGDRASTMDSTQPWHSRGSQLDFSVDAGTFSFFRSVGGALEYISHRTILLGY